MTRELEYDCRILDADEEFLDLFDEHDYTGGGWYGDHIGDAKFKSTAMSGVFTFDLKSKGKGGKG